MAVDDEYTVSLLHFNGDDGSTIFTDESGKAWTAYGNAQLDTAQTKFGSASVLFDNNAASYISTPYHSDFDISGGDWTVDFWVRLVDLTYHDFVEIGVNPNRIAIYLSSGALVVTVAAEQEQCSPGISINTWTHIAIVKTYATSKLKMFVGGVLKLDGTNSAIAVIADSVKIGKVATQGFGVNGWIDELRISNVARWTADFTPPTGEYTGIVNIELGCPAFSASASLSASPQLQIPLTNPVSIASSLHISGVYIGRNVVCEPFVLTPGLSGNVQQQIGLSPLEIVPSLSLLLQLQVPVSPLAAVFSLNAGIFAGRYVGLEPLEIAPSLSLSPQLQIPVNSLEIVSGLSLSPQLQVPVNPLTTVSLLDADISLGRFVNLQPLEIVPSLSLLPQLQVPVNPLEVVSSLSLLPQLQVPASPLTAVSLLDAGIFVGCFVNLESLILTESLSGNIQQQISASPLNLTPGMSVIPQFQLPLAVLGLATSFGFTEVWDGTTWIAWLLKNYSKTVRRYEFTLTGDADGTTDIKIPITSFQCRRRSAEPSYLSIVTRDMTYADEITARANGDIKVDMIYELYGEVAYQNTLISVHLEDIRIDRGPSNSSISLSGYQQTTTKSPKHITMQDMVYTQFKNGVYRYRCSIPNLYLNPGDTVVDGETSFVSDEIQYIVDVAEQSMEVRGV